MASMTLPSAGGDSGGSMGGTPGAAGANGWTPQHAAIEYGDKIVMQVIDWVGGSGLKPAVGRYISPTGYTTNINAATDYRGIQGMPGAEGKEGKQGTPGIQGNPGTPGATGAAGKDGKDGLNGIDGKDGLNGKDGKDGLNGRDGIDGVTGAAGRDGIDGQPGRDGKDGRDGIDGKDGKDGESAVANINYRDLHVNGNVYERNDCAISLEDGNGYICVVDTTNDPPSASSPDWRRWVLRGAPGQDGKDGKDGASGTNGQDGLPGAPGQDGVAGKDGKDGLNGKDGADGRDGRDGKDGQPGKDGADGSNGQDGQSGQPGVAGAPGKDGRDGIDGKDGAAGKDGVNGKDGADGKDGKDGTGALLVIATPNPTGATNMTGAGYVTWAAGVIHTTGTDARNHIRKVGRVATLYICQQLAARTLANKASLTLGTIPADFAIEHTLQSGNYNSCQLWRIGTLATPTAGMWFYISRGATAGAPSTLILHNNTGGTVTIAAGDYIIGDIDYITQT